MAYMEGASVAGAVVLEASVLEEEGNTEYEIKPKKKEKNVDK